MDTHAINFVQFTDNEGKRISQKWAKSKQKLLFIILFAILSPVILYGVLFMTNSKIDLIDNITAVSFSCLFIILFIVFLFSDKFLKDHKVKQKFIIRTIMTNYNYEQKIPFAKNIDLNMLLPLPIDFEYTKVRFYDSSMQKSTLFETKKSYFTVYISNGLKYQIYEHDFVSSNQGLFLELHIAKNSGFVLSVRKITDEINKEEAKIIRKKFLSNKQKNKENTFENIDTPAEIS